ncbi:MAG: MATE family efflux transporter [Firmicutes bacterium]|nr:MATE family efflux transporter [Bacillota bacterium]
MAPSLAFLARERWTVMALDAARAEVRLGVLALAWPAIVENILHMGVGIADVIMVGKLGKEAIASVDLANALVHFSLAVFAAVTVGTTALVARHTGAQEWDEAREIARQSIKLLVLLALVLGVGGVMFGEQLIRLMMILDSSPDESIIRLGGQYLRIVSYAVPFSLGLLGINAVLRGAGDTKTPMLVTGIGNVLNIILNYIFIFGMGRIPPMGVAGAALASAIARTVEGLLALRALFSERCVVNLRLSDDYRWNIPALKRIIGIGAPAAAEQMIMRGGQLGFGLIVAGLGTVAIASHAVSLTAESLSFMPGFGFALAATTLVGQGLGAGRPDLAEQSGQVAARSAAYIMALLGMALFLFPQQVVRLFTQDPQVIELASVCLRIVAVSQPALAYVMVMAGALRGAGDTRRVMVVTVAGIWGVRLTIAYFLSYGLGWGLVGAYVGMIADLFVRGALLYRSFAMGHWKTLEL